MSRARSREIEESSNKTTDDKKQANDALLNRQIRAANDAYETLTSARDALTNPTDFFLKAVSRQSPLYRQLFDNDGHLTNVGLAEELYRGAFNQARAGIDAQAGITNPVVSAIQSQSLEAINRYYSNAFAQLNSSFDQMMKLDANLKQSLDKFKPQTLKAKSVVDGSTDKANQDDCSVLANSAASRSLLEEHSDRWLALTARCTK
jgi:hypothetical protein